MDIYDINEVIEYAEDLKKELKKQNNLNEFNQAIMRLSDAAKNLYVIEDFKELKDNDEFL